jgi:amino acid adenylation domain-containing protein
VRLVEALLGVLKAGGAYLPLDMSYPEQRLRLMMEDASARVLLTDGSGRGVASGGVAQVINLEEEWEEEEGGEEKVAARVTAENLAYVIYTSGSTGQPKGVCINHRAIARLVRNTNYVELRPSDRVAQASNSSFDAATFEIWGALLNGARLVIIEREVSLSPPQFAAQLKEQNITVLFLTTALFNQVARSVPGAFASLRHLMVGGEALDPTYVREVLRGEGPRHLLNVYGPTENTTFSSWHEIGELPEDATSVPIGRPLSNSQMYVLDKTMRPQMVGVVGELYTGGEGLARGYLHRPALTAERFLPHPFSDLPGARLYRTGDLGRLLADGSIEFVGRVDDQVKIRGFRIELGEIEAALSEHPGVSEAAVVARQDAGGERRIVAYVIGRPDGGDAAAQAEPEGGLRADQVSHWQMIFDEHVYNQPSTQTDPTFNITGWNSTYTDEPIPAEEMRVWLDDTLSPLRAAAPRRILEIGCGTGLLLARLAPACEHYVGTDVSDVALDYVRQQVSRAGERLSHVRLERRAAHDFEGVRPGSFDAVILNSVVQYFPDAQYLLRVLEGAVRAVAPGGLVFVGDVRSLPLLEAFHASVQLFKARSSLPLSELREQVRARVAQENELVVDPAFFFALKERLRGVGRVEVRPKRGRPHNELTCFRYQVLVHVGDDSGAAADGSAWLDWEAEELTLGSLGRLLSERRPRALGLARVPNARLSAEVKALDLLSDEESQLKAGELRLLAEEHGADGVDPEDLFELARELSYDLDISWARHGSDGRFDVLFRDRAAGAPEAETSSTSFPEPDTRNRQWQHYTNNPLRGAFARQLVPQLRDYLRERLPDYMLPSAFVMLDALPLNANGKVDRRRLPAPDMPRPELEGNFVAPRTPIEQTVAGIWCEVLGLRQVGMHDNFFDLGGHSLLATQVVSRLSDAFSIDLPLRCLFESPTVGGLSLAVVQRHAVRADDETLARALSQLEQLSEEEVRALLARAPKPQA